MKAFSDLSKFFDTLNIINTVFIGLMVGIVLIIGYTLTRQWFIYLRMRLFWKRQHKLFEERRKIEGELFERKQKRGRLTR